jgi:RNA polymerase sigma-70 factor (ECF subfamily)
MFQMSEPLHLVSDSASTERAALERASDFEGLVQAEHPRLYGALWLITRDRGEAEDVMQEAFLRVWERWDRVGAMDDPVGYLYRTALNVCRGRIRRAAVAVRHAISLGGPRDELADVETHDQVVRALGRLTSRQRVSVVLVDLLDYSSKETAQLMGIKAATVRVLVSQARSALRRNADETDE